jgi:acetyl-CoA carboxylase alpha subunit
MDSVGDAIEDSLKELSNFGPEEIRRLRREKYLQIGKLENA